MFLHILLKVLYYHRILELICQPLFSSYPNVIKGLDLSNKKLQELEILRAMAIILIVFIHFLPALNFGYFQQFLMSIRELLTVVGLSIFFFVSGFVLYYNYPQISLKTLDKFYYKRLKRIYPLYWLTIILGLLLSTVLPWGNVNILNLMVVTFGLQSIFSVNPNGFYWFWFIGVLVILYLIYPVFAQSKNILINSSIALAVFLVILVLNEKLGILSPVINSYWIFFAGIIICWLTMNYKNLKANINPFSLISVVVLFNLLFISSELNIGVNFDLIYVLTLIGYTLIIYTVFKLFVYYMYKFNDTFFKSKSFNLIKKISTGSYVTYLIHPLILGISTELILKVGIGNYTNFILIFIAIPAAFILGYYIQIWEIKSRKISKYVTTLKDIQ